MHTMWKGSLSFGLVNVPVKMHAATESQEFQFHYLHKQCQQRVRYIKKCPQCEVEVDGADLVKGYEFEKDRFVILNDEDLDTIEEPISRSIDILDFVSLTEIDPVYFQKSYYLSPEDTALKAYRLLSQAMSESGKVAIARFTLRSKQHLACLRVYEQILILETMFYPNEIRKMDDSAWPKTVPTETELSMARQLIDNLVHPFRPEMYRDEVREKMTDLIASKVAGETIQRSAAPKEGKVLDLMEALRASIDMTDQQKGALPDQPAESSLQPRKRRSTRAKGA